MTTAEQLKPQDPEIVEVHQSSLNTLEMCPERYRRKEIERDPDYPGTAAVRGSGFHYAAQRNHEQKLETEKDLGKGELADLAAAGVEAKVKSDGLRLTPEEEAIGGKVAVARATDAAVRMSAVYADRSAPQINPDLIEKKISVLLPGKVRLVGTLDLSTKEGRIKDFKTTSKAKSQSEADNSLQFTMYGVLYRALKGVEPTGYDMEQFVDLKRGVEFRPLKTTRTEADRRVLVNRTNALVMTRKAGVFHAAPVGSWWCSPKWCGYWTTCPFVNSERTSAAESLD